MRVRSGNPPIGRGSRRLRLVCYPTLTFSVARREPVVVVGLQW